MRAFLIGLMAVLVFSMAGFGQSISWTDGDLWESERDKYKSRPYAFEMHNDTIAADDTVYSSAFSLVDIRAGSPTKWWVTFEVDTFGGHDTVQFDSWFYTKIDTVDQWFDYADTSNQFIGTKLDGPNATSYSVTMYGDSGIFYYTVAESCIVRSYVWQKH